MICISFSICHVFDFVSVFYLFCLCVSNFFCLEISFSSFWRRQTQTPNWFQVRRRCHFSSHTSRSFGFGGGVTIPSSLLPKPQTCFCFCFLERRGVTTPKLQTNFLSGVEYRVAAPLLPHTLTKKPSPLNWCRRQRGISPSFIAIST